MRLVLRYFAAFRDTIGRETDCESLPGILTVGDAISALSVRDDAFAAALAAIPKVRFAVNQKFATRATTLADGDELAVFPPVTGG